MQAAYFRRCPPQPLTAPMDFFAELLVGTQSLLAAASIALFFLSRRTSRSRHARHETFQAVAIFFIGVAAIAGLAAVYSLGTTNDMIYLVAVLLPFLTLALGAVVIVRASQANAISHRRRGSGHRPRV